MSANITVISELEIKESGARDLGEILAYQGFMVRGYPNSQSSVEVRGFRTETHGNDLSSYVLILINGRRAGTGNLTKILTDNVERIEIIRGPASVQYGASAMGGIVNVITKRGTKDPSFSIKETLGSFNYQKTAADASAATEMFDLSLSASRESRDSYTTADGTAYYNTGFHSKERLSVNAGWTFLPFNRIGVVYSRYDGDGIGSPDYLTENDLDDYVDNSIDTTDLTYEGRTREGFLEWNMRYFNGTDKYATYDPADTPSQSYYRDTDQQGAQAQVTVNWSKVLVTTGLDWTNYAITNTHSVDGENTYDNPAGFLMAKVKLMEDRLILSAGSRYDEYEVESDDGQSRDDDNVSANAGLVYKITSGLSVRLNYGDAFKMPTVDELYMFNDYSDWGFGIWSGNPDLKPEKCRTYDIGVDLTAQAFYGSLTYYSSDFEDKIGYRYIPAEDLTRYENMEGASIDGIEGECGVQVGDYFGWAYDVKPYLSFSCLTKRDDEENNVTLVYTPKWTGAAGIRIANPDTGFSSVLNITHTGDQDINDYQGTGQTVLPSMTVTDLTLSKRLVTFSSWGDLYLKTVIRNLFNEDYALVQGYPSPGRSFFVGLNYEY